MKKTVKIYKVTCTDGYQMAEQGDNYSLNSWGKDTVYYKGYDDGGVLYQIPEGYTIEIANDERLHFYDSEGRHVELISRNGKPALSLSEGFLFLAKA